MLRAILTTLLLLPLAAPAAAHDFPAQEKLHRRPEAFDKAGGILEPDLWSVRAVDPVLTLDDKVEVARAELAKGWGRRGDFGVYFPAGAPPSSTGAPAAKFLFGDEAKAYLEKGAPLGAIATSGMPLDHYGSANWAKSVAQVNVAHAVKEAKESPAFAAAIEAAVAKDPTLRASARRMALEDPHLVEALTAHAEQDPSFAAQLATILDAVRAPVAFMLNGAEDAEQGMLLYGVHKRRSNEALRAAGDKVVAQPFAKMMVNWWRANLAAAGPNGTPKRVYFVGHCAGSFETADILFEMLQLARGDAALVRTIRQNTFAYDLGAAANKPGGVGHVAQVGHNDSLGHLVSPSDALAKAQIVRAGHTLNTKIAAHTTVGTIALELRPVAEVFDHPLLPRPTPATPRAQITQLNREARTWTERAKQQRRVLDELQRVLLPSDKRWPTYQIVEANLIANAAIHAARARIADAKAQALRAATNHQGFAIAKARLAEMQAHQEIVARSAQLQASAKALNVARKAFNTDGAQYEWEHSEEPDSRAEQHAELHARMFGRARVARVNRAAAALETRQYNAFYAEVDQAKRLARAQLRREARQATNAGRLGPKKAGR